MKTQSAPNANYRRDKIPMWINILSGVVILILLFQMISALFNPSWAYGAFDGSTESNRQVILTLAGRNLTMILVTVSALRSQNAMFLAFTFLMGIVREFYDMALVLYMGGFTAGSLLQASSFLIFLIPYVLALKKLRALAAKPD